MMMREAEDTQSPRIASRGQIRRLAYWRVRGDEVVVAFLTTVTVAFVVFIFVPMSLKGFILVFGLVGAFAASWRALRLSIDLDDSSVVVRNYWRTHRFAWCDIEEIRPCAVTIGVLPRRALGFQLSSSRLICAQATGGSLRVRAAALAALRTYAETKNIRLSPELADEVGSGVI
jgi:hypothetical protein